MHTIAKEINNHALVIIYDEFFYASYCLSAYRPRKPGSRSLSATSSPPPQSSLAARWTLSGTEGPLSPLILAQGKSRLHSWITRPCITFCFAIFRYADLVRSLVKDSSFAHLMVAPISDQDPPPPGGPPHQIPLSIVSKHFGKIAN